MSLFFLAGGLLYSSVSVPSRPPKVLDGLFPGSGPKDPFRAPPLFLRLTL